MKKRLESIAEEFSKLTAACVVLLCVATAAGFLATLHPYLDWFANFRPLFAACGVAGFVVSSLLRRPGAAAAALIAIVVNVVPLAKWAPTGEATTCETKTVALSINAFGYISDHESLLRHVERTAPDILFVSEMEETLKDRLAARYPRHVWHPEHGRIGLFTRYQVSESTVMLSPYGRPSIDAVLATPEGPLRVVGAHTTAPFGVEQSVDRNAALREFAEVARGSAEPVVLLGDLNVTMFSPHYRPLEDAGLRNARTGRGVAGTWPNFSPIRIPIDHVLHSDELTTCELEVGESFASDHLPLRVGIGRRSTVPMHLAAR